MNTVSVLAVDEIGGQPVPILMEIAADLESGIITLTGFGSCATFLSTEWPSFCAGIARNGIPHWQTVSQAPFTNHSVHNFMASLGQPSIQAKADTLRSAMEIARQIEITSTPTAGNVARFDVLNGGLLPKASGGNLFFLPPMAGITDSEEMMMQLITDEKLHFAQVDLDDGSSHPNFFMAPHIPTTNVERTAPAVYAAWQQIKQRRSGSAS